MRHLWRGVCGAGLLASLLALAACGGGSNPSPVLLAPAMPGTPAPCAAAFDPPGSGLGQANTSPHDSAHSTDTTHALSAWLRTLGTGVAREVVPPAHAQTHTPKTVALSSCQPDAEGNITIGGAQGCGPYVVIDRDFTASTGNALGKITIEANGGLAVPHDLNHTLQIETRGIRVAGVLSLGTKVCKVGASTHPDGRVIVTFTGEDDSNDGHAGHSGGSGSDKGIEVLAGGTLRLYGAKGVGQSGVNWTHLAQPAGPAAYQRTDRGIGAPVAAGGERRLHLANDVVAGGWRAGDWIVVATSSFSPFESEFVQIDSVTATADDTSIVTLRQPLRHYHFGGKNPGLPGESNYRSGADVNFGVDERTEVGLISRSITLTSRTPTAPPPIRPAGTPVDPYLHWGGEIRILEGFTEVGIQGVELEKFGKSRLGSYPIHFHLANDAANKHLVDSNSIHHSYNKCITVHQTQNVRVTNNVCARAVGHLFYQEIAQEEGGAFIGNLGIGAQSHYFGLASTVPRVTAHADELPQGWPRNWWEGDHLARANHYDSLNVPNMDARDNPMGGVCYNPPVKGELLGFTPPQNGQCATGQLYVEAASGFWIGNPGTTLIGNAIAGCQGTGKGYWYVPPRNTNARFSPVGTFQNNRVHACYDGLFGENHNTETGQLAPKQEGSPGGKNVVGRFEGLTATRIRNRGVWVRPVWYAVENSRFATNRDSVSLLTSGGPDGNAPGVWGLLRNSVLVGLSLNNVDRWGPCSDLPDRLTQPKGAGCVDFHVTNEAANEYMDKGYQTPQWNSAGYMIYDGPVRILRNHFVNFRTDISSLLTSDDKAFMDHFTAYPSGHKVYEGDAALGWFQSNVSAYPTATVTRELSFDNVDFRHQIYTEQVNLADFMDGDMNTAVIDLDGTLTGYRILDAQGQPVPGEFPISLNNLPFNRTGNAVDECLATGGQDARAEGRPTSLISPANMATLEFEALNPNADLAGNARDARRQDMLFTRDWVDADRGNVHESMRLRGRNDNAVWEPKVVSGGSYSVQAMPSTMPGFQNRFFGMPRKVQVGLTDGVKSDMSPDNPFYVRVGICYTDKRTQQPPAGDFTIVRGYKSWGGSEVNFNDRDLLPYFNFYDGNLGRPKCYNTDGQNPSNLDSCPAQGLIGSSGQTFHTQVYSRASSIEELAIPTTHGAPAGKDKYFYDPTSGMLYFYVLQDAPNAQGRAPLGSCPGDTACPDEHELETYYPCPPQGCTTVMVTLNNPDYEPGEAMCNANAPGQSIYGADGISGFSTNPPFLRNRLGYVGETGASALVQPAFNPNNGFPHWVPERPPSCPKSTATATAATVSHHSPRQAVMAALRTQFQSTSQGHSGMAQPANQHTIDTRHEHPLILANNNTRPQ